MIMYIFNCAIHNVLFNVLLYYKNVNLYLNVSDFIDLMLSLY